MLTYRMLEINGDEYISIIPMEMKMHQGKSAYQKVVVNG